MSDRRDPPSDSEAGRDGARSGGSSRAGNDFQRAVGQLEEAVEALVGSARDQLSESAVQIIEETADRLRGRAGQRSDTPGMRARADAFESSDDARAGRGRGDRQARKQARWQRRQARWAERQARRNAHRSGAGGWWSGSSGGGDGWWCGRGRLMRDRRDAWIGGVCSGLARQLDMEAWVVRVIAVSLLLFTPLTMLVFCAYIAAWICLPDGPYERAEDSARGSRRGAESSAPPGADPDRHRPSVAPELGPRFSPRRSLREVRAQFDTVELKLRRMESFVTSPRFELERELARMDGAH